MAVSSVTCWNIKIDFLFFFSLFFFSLLLLPLFSFFFSFFPFQVGARKYEKFTTEGKFLMLAGVAATSLS
jgi:hypothetical protein